MSADGRQSRKRKFPGDVPTRLVESVNSLTPVEFFERYLPKEELKNLSSTINPEKNELNIMLEGASALSQNGRELLHQCLELIEFTSSDNYRKSEIKWSRAKKKKEMYLPDMRYVVLTEVSAQLGDEPSQLKVAGFVSFMITYEDGHEVIYCYEIHLASAWQGRGIGKTLMGIVEAVGTDTGVEKTMLTVFKSNERAVSMYEGLGYSEDEFSPGPRRMRNGTVKEPKYVILSKALR